MYITLMIIVFIIGYAAIALEHPIKINKTATALLLAVLCWVIYSFSGHAGMEEVLHHLNNHLANVSQIIFFLIGAMTIVELISSHNGFKVITDLIQTNSKRKLMWIIGFITFFLSAILDNLTTSIVIVTLLRKLVHDKTDRMIFASIVIIAANAGGAWTPIGDVTTTMLWIGGQITTVNIMKVLFIPSIICLVVPLAYQSLFMKGELAAVEQTQVKQNAEPGAKIIFILGMGALIFVPIFKTITHLPPYVGMLFGLSVLWVVTELMHHKHQDRNHLKITSVLTKIDVPSVLFFWGILLAINALETSGILTTTATWLHNTIGNKDVIVTSLGLLSAIIDNVPLTAACMGMYPVTSLSPPHQIEAYQYALANPGLVEHGVFVFNNITYYLQDAKIWEMLAFAVGTGGSCLIIGSAAGVVVMGMEKINFVWYMKKITVTALIGYFAGIFAYIGIYAMTH